MSGIAAAAPLTRSLPKNKKGQLPALHLAAFSALAMPVAAAQVPLLIYLPALLASHFGIALSTLGVIFLVEKLWGAAADPLIGVLSDGTKTRFGRRRIWIAAGGLLFSAAIALLFFPILPVTPALLCVELFFFYLAWSMIQIPYLAWSAEISNEYDERTRVSTWQLVSTAIALLLILGTMSASEQLIAGNATLKLALIGITLLGLMVLTLPLTLKSFPEFPAAAAVKSKLSFTRAVRILFSEPLLLRILGSDFAVNIGQSIRGSLFIFFVVNVMHMPKWSSLLFLFQFVFGLAAGPIWLRIGYRLGKHRAAVAAELTQAAINIGLLFLVPGNLVLFFALTVAQGFTQGSGNLMLRAMVGDVADAHRLRTGEDRTALFFSVFSISMKAGMAVAVGIALPLVAWFGFDPKSVLNTPSALHGVQLVFALGPALAHIISALFLVRFPLDAKAHAEIRRQLETAALDAAGLD